MNASIPIRELATRQLATLEECRASLVAEANRVSAQIEAWKTILKAQDEHPSVSTTPKKIREFADSRQEESLFEAVPIAAEARDIVRMAGDKGVRPRDVTKRLMEKGHKVSQGFASNTLFKMKHRGEVEERMKRYYWLDRNAEQPQGESPEINLDKEDW